MQSTLESAVIESHMSVDAQPKASAEQYRIYLGRSAGHFSELTPFVSWFARLNFRLGRDPRVSEVHLGSPTSPRILLNRNKIVEDALEKKCDFLLMVDPDMQPDFLGKELGSADFWDSTFPFMIQNRKDAGHGCVVGVPACTGYPTREPCVWRIDHEKEAVVRVTRQEAGRQRPCIEQVFAVGSGLMLIDLSIIEKLAYPWFDDVYADERKLRVTMTQDVYFCRNVNRAELPVFCNWMSWSAHWKFEPVCRPEIPTEYTITQG